ncbi:MAG: VIT1/CCC1 transporter family protein [Chlamydiota bacterium]
MKKHTHFAGKPALEHLVEARKKGSAFTQEAHASELSGFLEAGVRATQETVALFLIFLPLLHEKLLPFYPGFFAFTLAYSLWRGSFSALRGFGKLERLHRLIQEEHWEITHHRDQEREELEELYRAKGFSGEILNHIVTTLMSDDHRLLEVMLTEEIGIQTGRYEHPLKGAVSAFCTSLLCSLLFTLTWSFGGFFPSLTLCLGAMGLANLYLAHKERIAKTASTCWLLSLGVCLHIGSYLLLLFFQEL